MTSRAAPAKLSKNHELVYAVVEDQVPGTHLTMAQIHELAAARRPGIGFTTVYRALSRLRELRLVSEISLPGAGSAVYERASAPHAHFRCTACGSVADVAFSLAAGDVDRLAREHGFDVQATELSLVGLCARCR